MQITPFSGREKGVVSLQYANHTIFRTGKGRDFPTVCKSHHFLDGKMAWFPYSMQIRSFSAQENGVISPQYANHTIFFASQNNLCIMP
jgi:hypothetical protein